MKKNLVTLLLLALCLSAVAQPSATYYQTIDGLKKEILKDTLHAIINRGRTNVKYTKLNEKYPSIYYLYDDEKGKEAARVYDLFSDEVFAFTSTSAWNKEHVIPKSWWGTKPENEKVDAYNDIFSVIPSLSTANSAKSNYPPGIVDKTNPNVYKDSGRMWTGPATNGTGGSYSKVWEPYDDYKGDFARIIMYVATCYADIAWGSNSNVESEFNKEVWPTMNEWLYKLMLKWHNDDPVSEKEKKINNDAFDIQKNRNPFIDYPALADYIWGDYQTQAFDLSSAQLYTHIGNGEATFFTVTYMANGGSAAPAAQTTQDSRVTITTAKPYRIGYVFTGWNTRTDGRGQSYIPGQTYTLSANVTLYAQWVESGDNSETVWQLVTSNDEIATGGHYVIAYNTKNVVAGTIEEKKDFMKAVSATFSNDKTTIVTLPDDALVFTLDGTNGAWTLTCDDGLLGTTAAKKLAFGKGVTTWDIAITDGVVTIASTNSDYGILQFNEGTPRFNTYTSKQKPVQLYRQVESSRHYTVTTTEFNYATLFLDYPVTIPDGAEVFFATLTDDREAAILHPITDVIPALTAVIVRGEANTPYTFEEATELSATDASENLLIGYLTDTPITGSSTISYYAVNYRAANGEVGFFAPKGAGNPNGSFTAVAHKAYLKVSGQAASSLAFRFDDSTSIKDLMDPKNLDVWYDLFGRRLNTQPTQKGIYIVNGHKVILK
jgi:uncharacterized repeat protein (TIGR02543 family)